MPEIIDPVCAKTSQNARFLLSENERFGLVFVKTGSINSGTAFEVLYNIYFCKDDIGQDLYRAKVVCYGKGAVWGGGGGLVKTS